MKNDQTQSIYTVTDEEYDPMKPNDYDKLVDDLKKRKLYEYPQGHPGVEESKVAKQHNTKSNNDNNGRSGSHYKSKESGRYSNDENRSSSNWNKFQKDTPSKDTKGELSLFKPRYDEYDDVEKDFSASKRQS